jgi:hypothetical protein
MKENKKIFIFLVSIPVVAIIIIFMVSRVELSPSFSPAEQKVFNFTNEQTPRIEERRQLVVGSLKSPIDLTKGSEQGFPKTALAEIAPSQEVTENKVSFIFVNQKRKVAIVDGKLVHEGDTVDNHRVAKIEKNKILLKSKEGEKWLKLD